MCQVNNVKPRPSGMTDSVEADTLHKSTFHEPGPQRQFFNDRCPLGPNGTDAQPRGCRQKTATKIVAMTSHPHEAAGRRLLPRLGAMSKVGPCTAASHSASCKAGWGGKPPGRATCTDQAQRRQCSKKSRKRYFAKLALVLRRALSSGKKRRQRSALRSCRTDMPCANGSQRCARSRSRRSGHGGLACSWAGLAPVLPAFCMTGKAALHAAQSALLAPAAL